MKRKYLFLVFVFLVIISSFSLSYAETKALSSIKAFHTLDFFKNKTNEKYIDLIFSPIGWSKDGKFAYIIEIDPGGADYQETGLFRWVILDMVTDKCIWESEKEQEGDYPKDYYNQNKEQLFRWMYSKFIGRREQYLDKYRIINDEKLEILKFPLIYNNNEYRGLVTDVFRETKYGIPNMITNYKINVSRNGINKVFGQFNDKCLLDVQIAGYIKSPYEPCIALITCNIRRGWEGPPHTVEFGFVGCHLELGY